MQHRRVRAGGDPGVGCPQAGLPPGDTAAPQLGCFSLCSSCGMKFLHLGVCGGQTNFSLVDPNSDLVRCTSNTSPALAQLDFKFSFPSFPSLHLPWQRTLSVTPGQESHLSPPALGALSNTAGRDLTQPLIWENHFLPVPCQNPSPAARDEFPFSSWNVFCTPA